MLSILYIWEFLVALFQTSRGEWLKDSIYLYILGHLEPFCVDPPPI